MKEAGYMIRFIRNNKGSALLIALALMAMLTLAAITALDKSTTDMDMSYNRLHDDQAFYIAEAGAWRACAALAEDPDWRDGFARVPFNDGIYGVSVRDSDTEAALGDTVIVNSQAARDGAMATVEVSLVPAEFHPVSYTHLTLPTTPYV